MSARRDPVFAVAVFAFGFYSHAFDRVLSGNGNSYTTVTASTAVQGVALMLVLAGTLHWLWRPALPGPRPEIWAMVALALWLPASALWSPDPALSFRRAVAVVAVCITLTWLWRALGVGALWRALVLACAGLVLVQAAVMLAAPDYAFHTRADPDVAEHAGRFRGVYFHKNEAARFGALALLVLAMARPFFARWWVWAGLVALAVAELAATQSAKILVALPVAGAAQWVLGWPWPRWAKLALTLWGTATAGVGIALAGGRQVIAEALGALGRDPSLSGRDVIWRIGLDLIGQRPLTGGGFEAGWTDGARELMQQAKGAGGVVNHAHNGYIQITLDLGLIGLALALAPALIALWRLAGMARGQRGMIARFGAWFIPFYLVLNMAGSYIAVPNDIFAGLIVLVALAARPISGARRSPAAPAPAATAAPRPAPAPHPPAPMFRHRHTAR